MRHDRFQETSFDQTTCFLWTKDILICLHRTSVIILCIYSQIPLKLTNPNQLQLVWVGVDFIFPLNKKEGRNNPHLASIRRNDPSCLNFGDCLVSWGYLEIVWRASGGCLVGVWRVSGGCLEGVLRVSGRCLEDVCRVSMGCLNGNLVSQNWWCQDRSSHYRSSQDMPSLDRSSQDW